MKISILAAGALVCLGIAVVQASLYTAGKNSHLQMLERAKRSYMKRGSHSDEDGSCKLQCEDYGLMAYLYGVVANHLIKCYTYDIYIEHYTRSTSEESGSESEESEEETMKYFLLEACDFMQNAALEEKEAYEDPEYRPKIYTCSEYEYFLLAMSCLGTYMNLHDYYYAQAHTGNDEQDEIIGFLERDMLHTCNDIFFGPYCLVSHLTNHTKKHSCHELDRSQDFGKYFEAASDWLCDSDEEEKKDSSSSARNAEINKKITKADFEQINEAKAKKGTSKQEEAQNAARSKEFKHLNELRALLQGLLNSDRK